MRIQVLGPLAVEGATTVGPRDRVVLEVLVVRAGEYVTPGVLADALWGERLPASWLKVVQGCIARLRKLLGAASIETSPHGYRLVSHDDLLDVRRFERLLARAREHLGDGEADRAAYLAQEALSLWRGSPLADLDGWAPGRTEAGRLDGLRAEAEELRVESQIAGGRSRAVLEDARALVGQAPLRETRWALLARALYQSGRQSEALEVIQRARRMLLDELGLEPGAELSALQEAILRQDPDLSPTPSVGAADTCPYRGLLPYEEEDADAFFGREVDVATALQRLRERGVLVVVGASGTGKSSLVRAGVVATLRAEGTRVVVTTPGHRPLESLAALPRSGTPPVLVVDQAEEAVTLCEDAEERAAYFRALGEHGGPVVVALRADRMGDLSAYPEFAALAERGLHLLTAMKEEDLREAVQGPARAAGLRLEGGLVDLLVREVLGEPGALPLLSHALRQTWERREGGTLTVAGYRSTGGIRHAVARSAESLYEGLDPVARDQLRSLLLRLVTPSEDGEPVRTRVPRGRVAVDAAHESLVEALVGARLVSSDEGDLQIAHEALAREWPRLRNWLDEDVVGQRIFRHLANAAEAWNGLGRPESELYRGVRLTAATDWMARTAPQLTSTESEFLAASADLGDRETATAQEQLRRERQANRRLRGSLVGVAVLLVAALVAGVVAVRQSRAADSRAADARRAATVADANRIGLQSTQEHDLSTALLLAVEARRTADTPETRDRLLDALSREPALVRHRGLGDLAGIAMSPDASTYAVSSPSGGGISLVDAVTGQVRMHREGQNGSVAYVSPGVLAAGTAWTPELGEEPSPLKLLDAHTLEPLPTQLGGQVANAQVNDGLKVSSDGRWLVASFTVFDWPNGGVTARPTLAWDLRHPQAPVLDLDVPNDLAFAGFTDDDRLVLAYVGRRALVVHDLRSGRRVQQVRVPGVNGWKVGSGVASRSGRTLAVAMDDDLALLDTKTMHVFRRWHTGTTGVSWPTFNMDATRLATSLPDGSGGLQLWDTATGRQVRTFGAFGGLQQLRITFGRSGTRLVTASEQGLYEWDLRADHGVVPSLPSQRVGRSVYLRVGSPDGSQIAYVDSAGAAPDHFLTQVQDSRTGRILASSQTVKDPGINDLQWRSDGRAVAVTAGSRVAVIETPSGRTTLTPDLGLGHLNTMRYVDHDRGLLVLSAAGALVRVDPLSGAHQRTYRVPGHLTDLVADPRGTVALLGTDDGPRMLDLATGRVRRARIDQQVFLAAFSPDGTRLLASTDAGLGLYDVRRDRWLLVPSDDAESVAWSPDGRRLASGSGSSVTVRDGRTGRKVGTVEAGNAAQSSVVPVFRRGDPHVVIAGENGDLHTWDVRPASWVSAACVLAARNLDKEEWSALVGDRPYRRTCPEPADRG